MRPLVMPREAEPQTPNPNSAPICVQNGNPVRNAYGGRTAPWRYQDINQNTNKTAQWTPHPANHTAKEKNIAPQICMEATASRTKTGTPRYGSGCNKRRVPKQQISRQRRGHGNAYRGHYAGREP